MAEEEGAMVRLACKVQNYEWGRIGEDSEVGRLHALMSGSAVDASMPYAELWMGTHASAPSLVLLDGDADGEDEQMLLKDWLQLHPQALGKQVLQRWNGDLPFLFKVLSVAKALSIQAHPDKELAKYLHQQHPKVYKDGNHKPELALALTPFRALCGFVSSQELKATLHSVPELGDALGQEIVDSLTGDDDDDDDDDASDKKKRALRNAFTRLMSLDQSLVSHTLSKIITRLNQKLLLGEEELSPKEQLVVDLERQYPGDVGVLSALFLNYTSLAPGQAVFLGANEPHAYLSGDCVECMATSDNVVRAGLTPKLRDTQTLCSMLTYKQGQPAILDGCYVDSFTRRYSPPSDEFEVDHISIPVGQTVKISAACGPSIFLVFAGVGVMSEAAGDDDDDDDRQQHNIIAALARGNIFLLVAGKELDVSSVAQVDDPDHPQTPLQLYRAGVSSRLLHIT